MYPALLFPEAGHWMYWFWAFLWGLCAGQCQTLFVIDPEKPVWSYQLSSTCGFFCCVWRLQKGPSCTPWFAFISPGLEVVLTKTQNTQRSSSIFRLSVSFSHLISLRLWSSVGHKLHNGVARGIPAGGAIALMGKLCLRKIVSAAWGKDLAQGS